MLSQYSHKTKICLNAIPCVIEDVCPCGIDIGYSAIKVKSPNNGSVIPSLCVRVTDDEPLVVGGTDIRYRDDEGNVWFVGSLAKKVISSDDALSKTNNLLSRNRLQSEEFLVQIRVAMFFCKLQDIKSDYVLDERPLKIKTGLPPQYMKKDSQIIKERFIGTHKFSIKIGKYNWKEVCITIGENDVSVCRQPFGTLMSCAMNSDGQYTNVQLLHKNLLVVDPGFFSVDTLYTMQGSSRDGDSITWDNLGMKEVFQRTCNDIAKSTNNQADIDVYQLEKSLSKGVVYYGSRKQEYNYVKDFKRNLREVCLEFIKRLNATYNNMLDVDVIILTGGTGLAWKEIIEEEYKDMTGLTIMIANNGYDIVSANVQGYYNFLVASLKK